MSCLVDAQNQRVCARTEGRKWEGSACCWRETVLDWTGWLSQTWRCAMRGEAEGKDQAMQERRMNARTGHRSS